MPLDPGTKLGPYEILAPIGAGGMGEVYRARDPRLGRDVAVKVLPAAFARDRERLQRFEHEARAAGALNHPGVTAIYDVGTAGGIPYLVSELLDGESLRALIAAGPLPAERVADLGIQAAQALAVAHAKGIVHRDLKPENLHVLPDGRLKVLDFGLAKLAAPDAPPRDETGPQLQSLTMTGTILGTASYMAPEQVREQAVDHRADLFALGAILYELASGTKAFSGETPADRMTAILTQQPKPLPREVEATVPGLEAAIRRCLEKRADERFDSARDLAFTLKILVQAAKAEHVTATATARSGHRAHESARDLRFRQLTYREGLVTTARFASDGQTVVYGATWGGSEHELYLARVGSQEPKPLGLREAYLLAVSDSDELLVRLRTRDLGGFVSAGVLARVPLMGGVPRELSDDIFEASFGPGGRKITAVRVVGGACRLEYPIGTVLHETEGWISGPLVLPDERGVAFMQHPARGDNAGHPAVAERGGVRPLTQRFMALGGAALAPGGHEILVSGQESDGSGGMFLISLEGGYRPVLRAPGMTLVEDIAQNGDVLVTSRMPRMRMETGTREEGAPRDISWLDWSLVRDISADGSKVLFDETGFSVARPMVFLRGTDGSPAVHLTEGDAVRISPDGATVLAKNPENPTQIELVPVGIGESVHHDLSPVRMDVGSWFPDGASLCVAGHEPGKKTRLYRYTLATRTMEPLTEEGSGRGSCSVSPDGRHVFTLGPNGHSIYPVAGGAPRALDALGPQHRGIGWSRDGASVFAFERGRVPSRVLRIDVESGRADLWMEIRTRRESGIWGINGVALSADAERYVASYPQALSELHLVRGLFPA